jgi:TonB family protein
MLKYRIIHHLLIIGIFSSALFGQPGIIEEISAPVSDSLSTNNADTVAPVSPDTLAKLEKEPELITFVKARYPESLIAKGLEGTVTLNLLVNEKGKVDSVTVLDPLHPILDSLAAVAASQFIFSPGVAGGEAVPVYLTYNYIFTLDEITDNIIEQINVTGRIIEKGVRKPVADAYVLLTLGDADVEPEKKTGIMVHTPLGTLPMQKYLAKIGSFSGQSVEGRTLVTRTDSSGRFSFKSIPPGEAQFKITATGFDSYTDEIEIHDSEEVSLKVYLERSDLAEYEIIVYGKTERKEITRRSLKVQEAKRVPGFNGDVVKAVQALPGVARPIFGSTETILRGADWDDNKYYIDGVEVPYLWHDMGQNSVLNSNLVENINLYPSGFMARYGDALGGIIDVQTRKAKKDRWHCIADMNISYSSLVLEIPFSEKLSFIGSARREYYLTVIGFIAKQAMDVDLNFSMYYWDYSLRLDYAPTTNHSLFCEFIAARDVMKTELPDVEEESNFDYSKEFQMGVAGWDWKITDAWHNTLRYGLSPITMTVDFGGNATSNEFDASGYEHTVRDELQWKANEKVKTTLGLDLHLEPTDIHSSYEGSYYSETNYERRDTTFNDSFDMLNGSVGGYLSCEIKPIDQWTIIPEYRIDYYPGLEYSGSLLPEFWNYDSRPHFRWSFEPSLRLTTRYKLSNKHTVKGSAGSYNKSPGYYYVNDVWGNPKLEPARGAQYSLGYEWQLTDLVFFDVNGYLNRQWDKPNWISALERGESYTEGEIENRGKGRMRGIEFFLRHDQNERFFGWLSYSLAYSERYNYHEKKWIVFDRNILNNLQLVASLNLRKNINIGIRFQYTDGYPYTPAKRVLYYDAAEFRYVPEWGETNSAKYKPYLGLDFRFEKKIAFKRSLLTFYVGCDRILHFLQFIEKENGEPLYFPAEFPMYNYDYSQFEGMANFPAVSFGLSVEF